VSVDRQLLKQGIRLLRQRKMRSMRFRTELRNVQRKRGSSLLVRNAIKEVSRDIKKTDDLIDRGEGVLKKGDE
jgi:hypothetical protein